jgi:hypothetical protein
MLCSFAVENLLKARIVAARGAELSKELQERGRLPRVLNGHNLYELMKRAGMKELARKHEILLRRLERSATWYGRYPAPVSPDGLKESRPSENMGGSEVGLLGYTAADVGDIRRIVESLQQ